VPITLQVEYRLALDGWMRRGVWLNESELAGRVSARPIGLVKARRLDHTHTLCVECLWQIMQLWRRENKPASLGYSTHPPTRLGATKALLPKLDRSMDGRTSAAAAELMDWLCGNNGNGSIRWNACVGLL